MELRKPILAALTVVTAFGMLEATKERPTPLVPIPVKTITITPPLPPIYAPEPIIVEEKTKASWFDDKKVASGEKYDPKRVTCAHREFPFNTMLRITNLENGKSIICRVNDRGPAKWTKKNIDLSKEAAKQLGFLKKGVVNVKIEKMP